MGSMSSKLSPPARRLRTVIVTVPIMGATSFVLYKRLVLGEPQRTLPRNDPAQHDHKLAQIKQVGVPTDSGAAREEVWGAAPSPPSQRP